MSTTLHFVMLWAVGFAALAPLHGALPGIGSGLIAALVGAAFLYAGRQRQDGGVRNALLAVAVLCALLWLGTLTG